MKNENSASGSPGATDARAIILSLNLWPEAPRIDPIPAGFTNENFRVFAGGQAYFARAGSDLPHHGISRRQEARCAGIAARAGIAPEVIHARDGVLVTRFIREERWPWARHPPRPRSPRSRSCLPWSTGKRLLPISRKRTS